MKFLLGILAVTTLVVLMVLGGTSYLDYQLARRRRVLSRRGSPPANIVDSLATTFRLNPDNWLLVGLVAGVLTLFLVACGVLGGPFILVLGLMVVLAALTLAAIVISRLAPRDRAPRSRRAPLPARGPAANLKGLAGECAGLRFSVPGAELTIGREAGNAIVLNHPEVSRRHCRILRTSTGFVLEDRGSGGGTLLNGNPVTRSALKPGDEIRVRDNRFLFRVG